MNLNYQQPSLGYPLAGLQPGEPAGQGNARSRFRGPTLTKVLGRHVYQHRPLTVHTIADLQMGGQMIQVKPTTVVEPPIITDLHALREEEQSTESPITKHAFSMTLELLEYANVILGADLPRTLLAPDGDGGIGIEWLLEDRNLRVIIPAEPEQAAYVYRRLGRESDIQPFSKSLVIRILRSVLVP